MDKQISVLFLMGSSGVGGVERVSVVLANEFVARGVQVAFSAFHFEEKNLIGDLDPRVQVIHLKDGWLTAANRKTFRRILIERNVTHVINQWCVPFGVTLFCRLAARGLAVRHIAVRHGSPDVNKRILESSGARLIFWKIVSHMNMRLVYEFNDVFVLLSASFESVLKKTILRCRAPKARVIQNPVTISPRCANKEKIILYVGRLEEQQKRFSRVLEVWRGFSRRNSEWRLEVVGDGPDRVAYENAAKGLERIFFRGVQDPVPYYAKSPILLLISEIEGFPLVVLEAMSCSCYPVMLGSFSAAYDVKDACKVILPPYCPKDFVDELESLVEDKEGLLGKRMRAFERAKDYSVGPIVDKWMNLLEE